MGYHALYQSWKDDPEAFWLERHAQSTGMNFHLRRLTQKTPSL